MNVTEAKLNVRSDAASQSAMAMAARAVMPHVTGVVAQAAVDYLQEENQRPMASTCMIAVLNETLRLLVALDRDAVQDLVSAISDRITAERMTPEIEARQRDAQLRLSQAEIRFRAERSAAGRA